MLRGENECHFPSKHPEKRGKLLFWSNWKNLTQSCDTKIKDSWTIANAIWEFLIGHKFNDNMGVIRAEYTRTYTPHKCVIILLPFGRQNWARSLFIIYLRHHIK